MNTPDKKDARYDKTASPAFQHNQSEQFVEEIRARADSEALAQEEPNELGQQPMKKTEKEPKQPTQQELRERPRE
jgi:hypothetical protein